MKKQILPIALFLLSFVFMNGSVNAQCSPDNSITQSGVYQNGQSCFQKDVWTSIVWQIKNYDLITALGSTVHVDSIRVDSIFNLPAGLYWTTNKQSLDTVANNKLTKLENGCIWIYGNCTDSIGSYNTDIYVTAYIQGLGAVPQHLSTIGTFVRTRVIAAGGTCTPADSNNMIPSHNSKFGPTYTTSGVGIGEISENIDNLTNYPNPFGTSTYIMFTASETEKATFRVYDLVGKTLHEETILVNSGKNTITFERKGLTNGIYFYSISNGKKAITSKMVISE